MNLEELETVIVTQGFGLPDLYIDVEDSEGDDVDLTGYGTFTAKVVDRATGADTAVVPTVVGVDTGFKVSFTDANVTALTVGGDYLVQASATSGSRHRVGKCLLEVRPY